MNARAFALHPVPAAAMPAAAAPATATASANAAAIAEPLLRIDGLDIRLPPGADRPLAVQGATLALHAGQTLCVVGE